MPRDNAHITNSARHCDLRVVLLQGNIEKLSVEQLEAYNADLWLLAPPCQPYTLRGLQKDADDWRASSFMKLLLKLPHMQVCTGLHCNKKQICK